MLKRVLWNGSVVVACAIFACSVWFAGLLEFSFSMEPMLRLAGRMVPFWVEPYFMWAAIVLTGAFGLLAGVWAWRILAR